MLNRNKMITACFTALILFLISAPPAAGKLGKTTSIDVSEPVIPLPSHGDLWLNTWADDDSVFMSWGDGLGPDYRGEDDFSHHGLMRVTGDFPDISAELVQRYMPLSDNTNNSKPTSLLFLDGRLYVAIHSPLLTPDKGFIAWSDDYGATFNYDLDTARTLERNSNFICLIFINMGKAYELNTDGYVYAFGVQGEINVTGKVYLVRMPRAGILDQATWEYYAGRDAEKQPEWDPDFHRAATVPKLSSQGYSSMFPNLLFSAAYHPGLERYIVLTAASVEGKLYEAPHPWGPWRFVADWFTGEDSPWYASYMPGIVTRDMGPDYFYFTAAGRTDFEPVPGDVQYALKIGKITMHTADAR